jgi:hypothetical protein
MSNMRMNEVARIVAGALMTSNFSRSELLRIADTLPENRELLLLVRELLISVCHTLDQEPRQKQIKRVTTVSAGAAEAAYLGTILTQTLLRRRISKREALRLLSGIAPREMLNLNPDSLSMAEIIDRFVRRASDSDLRLALLSVGGSKEIDPYLTGIIKKK